ncbi:MAG: MBOAT family protein [Proteobacteria bacterium]|nr:MBOAT family protein [Pseudomonadota bacterium]
MLFSSQPFLLLFLPLSLIAYFSVVDSHAARLVTLTIASLGFYTWWDPRFLPLLVMMILFTWLIVRWHERAARQWILTLGIATNLLVLGLFKYANFFAESVLHFVGIEHQPWSLILPLGVSFFTFQQVSYLVDRRRGDAPVYRLSEYAAYVSFFPQLIAGPIVRHNQLIGQFAASPRRAGMAEQFSRGLVLLTLGLIKKVFLADELAPIANDGFDLVAAGNAISLAESWLAASAYSLQLYFDFSAYSDMAIGLGAMFGLRLPVNFDTPYRALDIRSFWRRWHMTLSSFFRDYVYITLGGNRHGLWMAVATVIVTMLLCGLWHGAGWTFVAWGGLHGAAICVHRVWSRAPLRLPAPVAWLLTMTFVIVGWVLFRAENFSNAQTIVIAMFTPAEAGGPYPGWDDINYVFIGALFALLGPTNLGLSEKPNLLKRGVAVATACGLFLIVLRVGQGRGLEFIYFQF